MARKTIIWLLLAIIVVIFALQNVQNITLKFFFWQLADVPLPIVILLSLLIGVVFMALISWPKTYKLRKTIKNLNKKIEILEEESKPSKGGTNKDDHNLDSHLEGDTDNNFFEE